MEGSCVTLCYLFRGDGSCVELYMLCLEAENLISHTTFHIHPCHWEGESSEDLARSIDFHEDSGDLLAPPLFQLHRIRRNHATTLAWAEPLKGPAAQIVSRPSKTPGPRQSYCRFVHIRGLTAATPDKQFRSMQQA